MDRNKLIALFVIVALVAGYSFGTNGRSPYSSGGRSRGGMMSRNIDQHFITQMIPHHDGAIAMAKLALERSKSPDVLTLAKNIIEAQEREIVDMRSWYQLWFRSDVPPSNSSGMMHMDSMEGDIDVLSSVPVESFDREFLEQMIPHHEMAIMMANMLLSGTERNEMRQLGENIISSQSSEIELMRSWLKDLSN
jgi:uncharacterized protein (DUF305 family)